MTPEHARVGIADDNPIYHELYTRACEKKGHEVKQHYYSVEEATQTAKLAQEIIDVFIIDGDLKTPGVSVKDQMKGVDGTSIAQALRKTHPSATLIGCREGEAFEGVDIFIPKAEWQEKLVSAVTNAPVAQSK